MFRELNDFIRNWEYEATSTQKVLDQLTDESLQQKIAPDHWDLGGLAWHIVTTIHQMMSTVGLTLEPLKRGNDEPLSTQLIAQEYRNTSENLIKAIKEQWDDDKLKEIHDFYGNMLPAGVILLLLLQHQTHHRGQMTVLMRQSGLKVPGVYGPSKDEWAGV
ncbi:DinB family protein [Rossellomorea sp. BNER]|uniref:DinB family protein n=1 Tax=Rossellomorea sp. BNER TaxID=2962031 RepID=UPI003AF29107|nr:DinB family protein [Rossellomorea sp. BNER]